MSKKEKVLIIHTGGTFGMSADLTLGKVQPKDLKEQLLSRVPEIMELADCHVEVLFHKDSSHLGADDWITIANYIEKRISEYKKFVVLHGTDTMAYTAGALELLLQKYRSKIRVVLTGAQKPLSAIRTDARRNLISALEVLNHPKFPKTMTTTVFFDQKLFSGSHISKKSATEFDGFYSPRQLPLANVETDIVFERPSSGKNSFRFVTKKFSKNILSLQITPEVGGVLKSISLSAGMGIILRVFTSGTAPTHQSEFLDFIKRARALQIPVVVFPDGTGMGIDPRKYQAAKMMDEYGVIWAHQDSFEYAFLKLSAFMGQDKKSAYIAQNWKKL